MYWANSRRLTAVQRIYAGFGEREEEEEEEIAIFRDRAPDLSYMHPTYNRQQHPLRNLLSQCQP